MPQILISPGDVKGDWFQVRGPEAHHIIRVLRKRAGDTLDLFDGHGARYEGELTATDAEEPSAEGRILRTIAAAAPKISISLLQGLPKGSKFDFILEKATELGVARIVPFLSQKSPIKIGPAESAAKLRRWTSLVKAASKQCGRATLPMIEPAKNLSDLAPLFSGALTLILWEKEKSESLKAAIGDSPKDRPVNIVIGPESGFAEKEIEWLRGQGGRTVSLGERIVRTETAGMAVMSILNYEWGLF